MYTDPYQTASSSVASVSRQFLSCCFAHLCSAKSAVIFYTFYNPSFSQCQRKIDIKHLCGNILTEVLVSLLSELPMKRNAKTVLP